MIRIEKVSKRFKQVRAVKTLSLFIKQGEFLALLGPNGAGKTTLVEMIEGLQRPDQGKIEIDGLNWNDHQQQIRQHIGLSLQETRFIDKLTVKEIMDLFGSFYHLPPQRSDELINLVDLEAKRNAYAEHLSGGQRQKLALAVSLLNRPRILILDEPTTGLDPNARREIWNILLDIKKAKKTTMILTTHYMEEAEKLCDRIVIMNQGEILASGTLQELLSSFSAGEIITFRLNEIPETGIFDQITGVCRVEWIPEQIKAVLEVDEIATALPLLLETIKSHQLQLLELESHKKTLDDLFVDMTGRRLNE
ncbi:MAG: ABC transporter ATP-binding protein [Candidatus Cyclobacteriaceae bacterium M3_2C_046]